MTISVTVDIATMQSHNLSTSPTTHYGMVVGVLEALAVSSTLLHGSVRTCLNTLLKI